MRACPIILSASLIGGVIAASRRPFVDLGATPDERDRPLPGDDLVPLPRRVITNAINIQAPPSAVWPWLAQMGTGRGGWYTCDRRDNGGVPSADRVRPELQRLQIGDVLRMHPDHAQCCVVADVAPERHLVLRSTVDLETDENVAPGNPLPSAYWHQSWTFVLEEAAPGLTRLIARYRLDYEPRLITAPITSLIGGIAHAGRARRQLHGIRQRVETATPIH